MQDHRVFILLSAAFAILVDVSYGAEDQTECKNTNYLRVLNRCCNAELKKKMTEEKKAVGTMCFKTIFGDGAPPSSIEEQLELYECMDECLFNASHMLTADMKLNETAIIAEFDDLVENSPHWKEPIAKALKKCVDKYEVKPEAKCKSGAYQFSNCFGINIYLNCPPENWKTEEEECNKIRETLQKC